MVAERELTFCGPADGGNFECAWGNAYLQAHLISDVGKRREGNEDACVMCAPVDPDLLAGRGYLFGLADGMGGASAGEHASHLALKTFTEEFYNEGTSSIPERVRHSAESANRVVFDEAEENPAYHGMGTTLSTLSILGDCAYVGHVGDSRVYLQRDRSELLQITEDHSLVAEQVRGGIITKEEARNHTLKNLITRAIGIKEAVEVDLFSLRLRKGDTLLLCSDGLCGLVEDAEIAPALKVGKLQTAARLLVGKALEAGGTDNVSVTLVRLTDTPPRVGLQEGCAAVHPPASGVWGRVRRLLS